MIPRSEINAWRENVPWQSNEQVEQDLIITRFIVDLFSNDKLKDKIAFRGGTAIHKLFISPPARYSDDIDLVQIHPGPIGEIVNTIQDIAIIKTKPAVKQKNRNNTVIFSYESEIAPIINMKLKIEINCREHFNVFGLKKIPFEVKTRLYDKKAQIITYTIEELLGTKIRALYQRKKGRDLFDLWYVLTKKNVFIEKVVKSFLQYMKHEGRIIRRKELIKNMQKKLHDNDFTDDTNSLLHPAIDYDVNLAWKLVQEKLISKIS